MVKGLNQVGLEGLVKDFQVFGLLGKGLLRRIGARITPWPVPTKKDCTCSRYWGLLMFISEGPASSI